MKSARKDAEAERKKEKGQLVLTILKPAADTTTDLEEE